MMEQRLTLGEMFGLIGADVPEEARSQPFPGHVATDNRYVEPGGAFVALEGERTDGHHYIPQAVDRGAGLIIVRRGKRPEGLTVPCVELDEPEVDLARRPTWRGHEGRDRCGRLLPSRGAWARPPRGRPCAVCWVGVSASMRRSGA